MLLITKILAFYVFKKMHNDLIEFIFKKNHKNTINYIHALINVFFYKKKNKSNKRKLITISRTTTKGCSNEPLNNKAQKK
jgi:hypothetical protein